MQVISGSVGKRLKLLDLTHRVIENGKTTRGKKLETVRRMSSDWLDFCEIKV